MNSTQPTNVAEIILAAQNYADEQVNSTEFSEVELKSNGSEAWQAVSLRVKGMRKVQNQLKKIEDVRFDSYHGYLVSAPFSNYFLEEAWLKAFAGYVNKSSIPASYTERLL